MQGGFFGLKSRGCFFDGARAFLRGLESLGEGELDGREELLEAFGSRFSLLDL
jgi:hypothetical protein